MYSKEISGVLFNASTGFFQFFRRYRKLVLTLKNQKCFLVTSVYRFLCLFSPIRHSRHGSITPSVITSMLWWQKKNRQRFTFYISTRRVNCISNIEVKIMIFQKFRILSVFFKVPLYFEYFLYVANITTQWNN